MLFGWLMIALKNMICLMKRQRKTKSFF